MAQNKIDIGQIAIAGAIAYGVYVVSKLLTKKDVSPDLDIPGGGGITTIDANMIGQRLYQAMKGFGTDEATLFSELQNLTAQQLISVYNAYGTPYYFLYGGDPYFGSPLDLFGWFNEELSGNKLAQMKQIWAKTGLTWN